MTGPSSTPKPSAASLTAYLLNDLASLKRWRERVEDRLHHLERVTYALATRGPAAPQSWWTAWGKEFGRAAGKMILPQLAPLVWAWVLALGSVASAVGWAAWRILRGYFGF